MKPSKARRPLVLKRHHAAALRRSARIVDVPPQTLIDWQLDDLVKAFEEPGGYLSDWAVGPLIKWGSDEEREAARLRFAAWLRRKGVPAKQIAYLGRPGPTDEQIHTGAKAMVASLRGTAA